MVFFLIPCKEWEKRVQAMTHATGRRQHLHKLQMLEMNRKRQEVRLTPRRGEVPIGFYSIWKGEREQDWKSPGLFNEAVSRPIQQVAQLMQCLASDQDKGCLLDNHVKSWLGSVYKPLSFLHFPAELPFHPHRLWCIFPYFALSWLPLCHPVFGWESGTSGFQIALSIEPLSQKQAPPLAMPGTWTATRMVGLSQLSWVLSNYVHNCMLSASGGADTWQASVHLELSPAVGREHASLNPGLFFCLLIVCFLENAVSVDPMGQIPWLIFELQKTPIGQGRRWCCLWMCEPHVQIAL